MLGLKGGSGICSRDILGPARVEGSQWSSIDFSGATLIYTELKICPSSFTAQSKSHGKAMKPTCEKMKDQYLVPHEPRVTLHSTPPALVRGRTMY